MPTFYLLSSPATSLLLHDIFHFASSFRRVQQGLRESGFISHTTSGDGYFNINTSDPSRGKLQRESGSSSCGGGKGGEGAGVFPYASFPPGAVMKKGFQRVTILSSTSNGLIVPEGRVTEDAASGAAESFISGTSSVYEVVIHGGEAFLKMKHLQIGRGSEGSSVSPGIAEYSTGWQHSMLLLADG